MCGVCVCCVCVCIVCFLFKIKNRNIMIIQLIFNLLLCNIKVHSSSSALQIFVSFVLFNYSSPSFPFLCLLFPIIYYLIQVFSHVIFPSLSWPSFRSCCLWCPFINIFNYSVIRHSFNMSHPIQSLLLMCLTIFSYLISFFSSSFVFCLHSPFVFCVEPKILFNIFFSITNNFCLIFSFNNHLSDPYSTTGLINVWYSLSLVFLLICTLISQITSNFTPQVSERVTYKIFSVFKS